MIPSLGPGSLFNGLADFCAAVGRRNGPLGSKACHRGRVSDARNAECAALFSAQRQLQFQLKATRKKIKMPCRILLAALFVLDAPGATVNVKDFGVTGKSSADDTRAIQKAINSLRSGDTLTFPAGTYKTTKHLTLKSNATYRGQSGSSATIIGTGGYSIFFIPGGASGINIDGLVLKGGGIKAPDGGSKITITNNTIQNVGASDDWTEQLGIFFDGGSRVVIDHNTLYNIFADPSANGPAAGNLGLCFGIGLWNTSNSSVTNNKLDKMYEGIGMQFLHGGSYPGMVASGNTLTQIHRMGIETQTQNGSVVPGFRVNANSVTNFLNPYYDTFALSIALGGGIDTIISNNYGDASPPASGGNRYGYGIEVDGARTQATNNQLRGNWTLGIALGGEIPKSTISGNYLCGSSGTQTIGWEVKPDPSVTIANNTVSHTCSRAQPPPPPAQ